LVQDTTDIDLTCPNQQVKGVGPLEYDARHDVFFHPLLAFNSHGLPLGVAWQKSWTRNKIRKKHTKKERDDWHRKTPIEGKESFRWIEGMRAARDVAEACPRTTCVCIADSDADVYELFCESRSTSRGEMHFLVRACQNRNTRAPDTNLLDATRGTPCLFQCSVTTLPIDNPEQVQQIVSYYSIRWQIEIHFRTLKSGCRIENRQFETLDRLLNCLAVYSIIAWKIMYLCHLGRECPDLDCEIIFKRSNGEPIFRCLDRIVLDRLRIFVKRKFSDESRGSRRLGGDRSDRLGLYRLSKARISWSG
jgi:hypothetical protein